MRRGIAARLGELHCAKRVRGTAAKLRLPRAAQLELSGAIGLFVVVLGIILHNAWCPLIRAILERAL
jgi:hypothetical protein